MRKIIPGVLLALLAIAAAPAYAQSNTELINDIYDSTLRISSTISQIVPTLNDLIDELRVVLDGMSGIVASVDENKVTLEENAQSLKNIEAALLGQVCGEGTYPIGGICVAEIVGCDAEVNMAGICEAKISCGEGTIQHLDTCIADISISYCGEGTIFEGGVCVADMGHTPEPGPTQTQPTEPEVTDRHIIDGDTIQIDTNSDGTLETYDLAFVDVPSLSETGGRAATNYLLDLCDDAVINIIPDTRPKASPPKALIQCNTYDVAQTMINAGHGTFDAKDCNIRAFIGISEAIWHDEQCRIADAAKVLQVPPTTAPTPTPTPTPTTPPAPKAPILGNLERKEFTFPVTLSEIYKWDVKDGIYASDLVISCDFAHTPEEIDIKPTAVQGWVSGHGPGNPIDYQIATGTLDYTDVDYMYSTKMLVQSPIIAVNTLFDQSFVTSGTNKVVFDRAADVLTLGKRDGTYTIRASISDMYKQLNDDKTNSTLPLLSGTGNKVFDIYFKIITDYSNNKCELNGAGTTPTKGTKSQTELRTIAGTAEGIGFTLMPLSVTCSEDITITAVRAESIHTPLSGFDRVEIVDRQTDTDKDVTISATVEGTPITGLSFTSNSFTIGDGNKIVFQNNDGDASSVVLMSIDYTASSDKVCTWN